jgi:hypothetical protein
MNRARFTHTLLATGVLTTLSSVAIAQNPVVDWNSIASTTIITNGATCRQRNQDGPRGDHVGRLKTLLRPRSPRCWRKCCSMSSC